MMYVHYNRVRTLKLIMYIQCKISSMYIVTYRAHVLLLFMYMYVHGNREDITYRLSTR